MMRRTALAVVCLLVAAACSSEPDVVAPVVAPGTGPATTSSTAPSSTSPSSTEPPISAVPTTEPPAPPTVAPTTATTDPTVDVPPVIGELPTGPCSFTAPSASVTFVVGTRLYATSVDGGDVHCLGQFEQSPDGPLLWGPAGDRLLIGGLIVLGPDGVRDTGFDDAVLGGVQWSRPTGSALLAPVADHTSLTWRNSTDGSDHVDVSFLARTDVAAYHPAGRHIVAAGMSENGLVGLFLAGNRGEDFRLIASLDDEMTRITELSLGTSGDVAYFLHDHGSSAELHRLTFPQLQIDTLAELPEQLTALTISNHSDPSIAYRVGGCDGRAMALIDGATIDVTAGSAIASASTAPVGWVDGGHLLLGARSAGCSGPLDLWVWDAADGALVRLVADADGAAVRTVLDTFGELPGDIEGQAPG